VSFTGPWPGFLLESLLLSIRSSLIALGLLVWALFLTKKPDTNRSSRMSNDPRGKVPRVTNNSGGKVTFFEKDDTPLEVSAQRTDNEVVRVRRVQNVQ